MTSWAHLGNSGRWADSPGAASPASAAEQAELGPLQALGARVRAERRRFGWRHAQKAAGWRGLTRAEASQAERRFRTSTSIRGVSLLEVTWAHFTFIRQTSVNFMMQTKSTQCRTLFALFSTRIGAGLFAASDSRLGSLAGGLICWPPDWSWTVEVVPRGQRDATGRREPCRNHSPAWQS